MTIRRLLIVSITALVLHLGSCPGTMALGQGSRETSERGAERQVGAAPGPPAAEANASTLPDAPSAAWQQNSQNTPARSGAMMVRLLARCLTVETDETNSLHNSKFQSSERGREASAANH